MKADEIENVGVIGAGLMGHAIAQIFAACRHKVCLYDIKEEFLSKALENIDQNLNTLARNDVIAEESIGTILDNITTTTNMETAASDAQFLVEAVPENLELKQQIFQDLDRLCNRDAILATNTSVMSISEIASKATNKDRIVGTHFWNPPYLIPLVEVVKGNDSSDETVETTYQFLKKAGKHPVKVMKDVPGFIGNRLQHALWREAMSIVAKGIATPSDVDDVVKKGFGARLPVLAPLENADMIGLDLTLDIHSYILKHLEVSPDPSPALKERVDRSELGFKSGQGFHSWTSDSIEETRHRLLEYLLEWNRGEDDD